jgi:dihydropteroate synthase
MVDRAAWRAKRDQFLGKIGKRPIIMGILNLTPDSFSDGGRFVGAQAAVARARAMAWAGGDIIDVGGESTRPGAVAVTAADELQRVEAIFAELATSLDVPLSIDTYKSAVAARALELGAILVNDVWGLQKDPAMAATVAAAEAAVVIMHNRLQTDASIDIIADIRSFFDRSLALAEAAGIPRSRIILDPGVAFAKTSRQNVEAIAGIERLLDFGCPILVGLSRKAFLGSLGNGQPEATLVGTVAANLAACAAGAMLFRVHDVAEHVAAFNVFQAVRRPGGC